MINSRNRGQVENDNLISTFCLKYVEINGNMIICARGTVMSCQIVEVLKCCELCLIYLLFYASNVVIRLFEYQHF